MEIFQNDRSSLNIEHLYTVGAYFTCNIEVKSSGFGGCSNFCISLNDIERTNKELRDMYKNLKGTVLINDSDSDSFIKLEAKDLGQLLCVGEIGGSYRDHSVRFSFQADQTILKRLMYIFTNNEAGSPKDESNGKA